MAVLIPRALALCLIFAGLIWADIAPLIAMTASPLLGGATGNLSPAVSVASSGSLALGPSAGVFAPPPPRVASDPNDLRPNAGPNVGPSVAPSPVAQLLSLIAQLAPGQGGYDAVQNGAELRPARPLTAMRLSDIYAWVATTPGLQHRVGRYQFTLPTLQRLAQIHGFGPDLHFTAKVQDTLALALLEDAGLRAFEAGTLPRRQFMHNLARIWAGLPLPNGRSFYAGHAGNGAAMTWAQFESRLGRIWPRA